MLQPQHATTNPQTVPLRSLRDEMERRRRAGGGFSLVEVVAVLVPLTTEIAQRHARGERFFLTPSTILIGPSGQAQLSAELAITMPVLPSDQASLAPEERQGAVGDARASVFSLGAIAYEMLTGRTVGPGMARPTQLVPTLPAPLEIVLGKALVTDRAHRPDDLRALAQALHHFAPSASLPPPRANGEGLDHGTDFEIDVSLSLLPPPSPTQGAQVAPATHAQNLARQAHQDPLAMPVVQAAPAPVVRNENDPTTRLADLKARLEADRTPRYVVVKNGMDHGPFSAVELLQQIGSHSFRGKDVLRDTVNGTEKPIAEWNDFAPFSEQAELHREIQAEKRAIERVVVAEAKGNRNKVLLGTGLLVVILVSVGTWWFIKRGARNDAIEVASDDGIGVDVANGLKGEKKKPGSRLGTGPGGIPILSGGMSCEQARSRYIEEMTIGQQQKQADLTANQLGGVLNNGAYLNACGTPNSMHVTVCAAIQNGHAVGVTVSTDPPNPRIAGCVASQVRRMSFPSNPKLDITTTRF